MNRRFDIKSFLTSDLYNFIVLLLPRINNNKTSGRGRLWGPLLICLLNFTLNKKSSEHSLQFMSKDHVSSDSLRAQITEHTHRNFVTAALYYEFTGYGLSG